MVSCGHVALVAGESCFWGNEIGTGRGGQRRHFPIGGNIDFVDGVEGGLLTFGNEVFEIRDKLGVGLGSTRLEVMLLN